MWYLCGTCRHAWQARTLKTLPTIVAVITGVAGSGKSTVGRALATRLGWHFHDADDLHAPENIALMRQGVPLNDEQRQPWLLRVRAVISAAVRKRSGAVVACSALKEQYRDTLADGLGGVRFVFLEANPQLLKDRLTKRLDHYAGPGLIDSQLQALEPPVHALRLDASRPVDVLVEEIQQDISRLG